MGQKLCSDVGEVCTCGCFD